MKTDLLLALILIVCLAGAAGVTRRLTQRGPDEANSDEQLYLNGRSARRMSLAFNGLAADWYWMRSLQYVGGKVVKFEDEHNGQFDLSTLSKLDLRLLPSLLDVTTTLDPQFIPAYEYGAVILPEINPDAAITLLNKGIAANPSSWRLHQDLGYIYWQRKDYARAADVYEEGAKLPGAPAWVAAMAARMKAEGGSREAARQMYAHLAESSKDQAVQKMIEYQLESLDSIDERDVIRHVLEKFKKRTGHCVAAWNEVANQLRAEQVEMPDDVEHSTSRVLKLNAAGAPLDPTGMPYRLINGGCDVDLDPTSQLAH